MAEKFDVIVVGVGAMGSSACWHLARRGVRVLGLEQFSIPHTRGSSHGLSRMIRLAYYEHPHYVPLLLRAYELWRQIERDSGQSLLHEVGGVYMGPPGSEVVGGSLRAAEEHRLPHEALDARAIRARWPQFDVPGDYVGLHEPRAGYLLPERAIETFVAEARRHGAQIHENEPVLEWEPQPGGVVVTTPRGEYRADKVIFASGPWSGRIVRGLGLELIVTRQVLGWVWPINPLLFEYGSFPVWAIDRGDGLYYGFPILPADQSDQLHGTLKLALHARGEPSDPDTADRSPRADDERTFRPCLERMLPSANGPLAEMRICLYTNSPDSHFILDRHPRHERVIIACGFSGHGFKFASVIGEALADLSTHAGTNLPVDFLGLLRFR